jgi:Leucine-rich repeat (LRR) protein
MTKCSYCGENIQILPFKCLHCGKVFCVHHRLSDNHECSNDLEIEKIQDSIQKKALEREKVSKIEDLTEELNRELKLLVEMGFIGSEELKEGYYTDLDQYELYPDRSFFDQSLPFLNYKELTRDLARNSEYPFIIGNYNVIALYLYQKELPESIKLLKKLKIVVIDNANMVEFPKALAQLSNLRYLYIKESNLTDIPNLASMFPKLIYLGLRGIKFHSTPKWLFEFARKHHSRQYLRKSIGDMNQIVQFEIGWIGAIKFNRGVDKKDAAVLGFLEILNGNPIGNDQPDERITSQHNIFRDALLPKFKRDLIEYEKSDPEEAHEMKELVSKSFENYPENPLEQDINLPWDYRGGGWGNRYTINESGNVIGLDIGYLPYFPEEISKLQHLKVLKVSVRFRSEEDMVVDSLIPESIRDLKSLRYFWTNAKYSKKLQPFLDSLEEFG